MRWTAPMLPALLLVVGCNDTATAPNELAVQVAHIVQHDGSAVVFGINTERIIYVQPGTVGLGPRRTTILSYSRLVPNPGEPGSYIETDGFTNISIPNEDFTLSRSGSTWELHGDFPPRGRIDLAWTNPGQWGSFTPQTSVFGPLTVHFVGQSLYQDLVPVTGTV
jgi:hypothetical protein